MSVRGAPWCGGRAARGRDARWVGRASAAAEGGVIARGICRREAGRRSEARTTARADALPRGAGCATDGLSTPA